MDREPGNGRVRDKAADAAAAEVFDHPKGRHVLFFRHPAIVAKHYSPDPTNPGGIRKKAVAAEESAAEKSEEPAAEE